MKLLLVQVLRSSWGVGCNLDLLYGSWRSGDMFFSALLCLCLANLCLCMGLLAKWYNKGTTPVGPPHFCCISQSSWKNALTAKQLSPCSSPFCKNCSWARTRVYNLREYIQNDIWCGQERSGAKVHGHGLFFVDGGPVNNILITSSYLECCFLLVLRLSAWLMRT